MIGLICSADDAAAAEEFFQLFKTPWEPWVPGRDYDVVITTTGFVPETDVRLLLIFRSGGCSWDASTGIKSGLKRSGAVLEIGDVRIPVYCGVVTFEETGGAADCVGIAGDVAGLRLDSSGGRVVRLGYDLFQEVHYLLVTGQSLEHATVPALDLHIDSLRRWILEADVPLVEIPPAPAGTNFVVCLTHDIDFTGIRCHRFDHTMWGFAYRATVGALVRFLRGRMSLARLLRCWGAAASLPLVHLGWRKDYWIPFEWYLEVEDGLGATYYLIPFKGRSGEKVRTSHPERRAAAYELSDLADWIQRIQQAGGEIGVHGIDAWHSPEKGAEERLRLAAVTGTSTAGVRMHWLLTDRRTPVALDEAGYDYDATVGYNETPGYRAGTTQVYQPFGTRHLLELPLHIQDGALFYPQRLDLSDSEAWKICNAFIDHALSHGGVLSILWHDRSHGPERYWGDFYIRLVSELKKLNVWFPTAAQAVDWFRRRRSVGFERRRQIDGRERVIATCPDGQSARPFMVRVHDPRSSSSGPPHVDVPWTGESDIDLSSLTPLPSSAQRPLVQRVSGEFVADVS